MRDDTNLSCREFTDILSSSEPVPGGGGAAALVGAIGMALGNMVGSLTVGKKKYADVEEELRSLMDSCAEIRRELLDQVAADAEGFAPLAAAYGIPKDDPDRETVLEEATKRACAAPLRIMELCVKGIKAMRVYADKGSKLAVSDAGCGAVIMKSALQAAALNVYINTKTLKDREAAEEMNEKCRGLMTEGCALADGIYENVKSGLE